MELREYIRILRKHMLMIMVFTVLAFVATMFITYEQTPIVESQSTYVTRLESNGSFDAFIYGMDVLSGRDRIFVTYCDVIQSQQVRTDAISLLGLNPLDKAMENYTAECVVLPGSNVMVLTVEGPNPVIVQELNRAIGYVGAGRANGLYQYFKIEGLDPVVLNPEPVSPNYIFNGALGIALGLLVSVTVVILLDYLRTPQEKLDAMSIYDPRLNVYNNRYMQRRLSEEISRAKMQNRIMAVALMHLVPDENFLLFPEADQELLLRAAATRLRDSLRATDIIAYRGDQTFAFVMPETSEAEALQIFRKLHEVMRAQPIVTDRYISNFTAITGLVENNGGTLDAKETMKIATDALTAAMASGVNTIEFIRTKPSPFTLDETEMEHFSFDLTEEFNALQSPATPRRQRSGTFMTVAEDTSPIPDLSDLGDLGGIFSMDDEKISPSVSAPTSAPAPAPLKDEKAIKDKFRERVRSSATPAPRRTDSTMEGEEGK